MTEVIESTEVKAKAKKGPQGPIRTFIILGASLGEFFTVDEYVAQTGLDKSDLRDSLNLFYKDTPASKSAIRVPADCPALVLAGKDSKPKVARFVFILPDFTAVYSSTPPEGYIMGIDLKNRKYTNSNGTFDMPWELGVFLGTRPAKKVKE